MYYAYAFMNVIVYIIYAIFLIIGAHTAQPLFGLLPLLVFYTTKYTGGFFWYSFSKMQTAQLFRWLILCAVVGCLLGIASPKYPAILNVSAMLLGLSCSIVLPTYMTMLKRRTGSKKTQMIWSALLTSCWVLVLIPAISSKQFSFVFLWIGLAFFFLFFLPVNRQNNELVSAERPSQRYIGILAFVVLSAMLFIVKLARTVEWQTYFSTIILVVLFLITCTIMWYSWRSVQSFSTKLHLYSYADGLLVAFFFMATVFEHWLTSASTLHVVYIPYIIGVILSFIVPVKLSRNALLFIVLLSSWGLVYSPLITVVALAFGYFHTILAANLNGDYYEAASTTLKDDSLLIKNRFYRLGGISIQVIIVAFIVSLSWQRDIDLPEVMRTVVPSMLPAITIGFNSVMTIFISWLVFKKK